LLDLLYAQAAWARRRWYERRPEARRHLQRPVISVGNLSVGGTGKTPVVATVAGWLLSRGERPAILSRGHGRRVRDVGVVVASDGTEVKADLDMAGDEPLMLARAMPRVIVAVCEDRYLAGVLAERRLGATVHILDDGFQHVALARDLDVLVTAPGEIGNGRVLPFGRLREPRDAAARAHVVVVMGADAASARSEAWALGISQSAGATRAIGAVASEGAVLAVAGIGDPQQFFDALRSAGCDVRGTKAFPDHHRYTRKDVDALEQARRAVDAESVVTTAKDLVRFEALGRLPFQVSAVSLSLQFDPPDVLFASIDAALARARNAA
jgi:tetraacyldisaccharide 4'-kinase